MNANLTPTLRRPTRQNLTASTEAVGLTDDQVADIKMLKRVGHRDVAAFQELFRKFSGLLYSTIYRVLNDHQDTEDIMQEVLMQIWQKAHLYEEAKGKPLTWIMTMARNRAIDRVRSKQRRSRLSHDFEHETKPLQPEFDDDTSDVVISGERDRTLQNAVMELSPEQREAIQLAYFNGLTQSEIAERLHEPLGTVKARIRRGVQRLEQTVRRKL